MLPRQKWKSHQPAKQNRTKSIAGQEKSIQNEPRQCQKYTFEDLHLKLNKTYTADHQPATSKSSPRYMLSTKKQIQFSMNLSQPMILSLIMHIYAILPYQNETEIHSLMHVVIHPVSVPTVHKEKKAERALLMQANM